MALSLSVPPLVRNILGRRAALKPLLLSGIAVLALGAAYTSLLVVQQQNALSRFSRYNITWDASQALAELLRLEAVVGAYAVPDGGLTKEAVQLRLEIAANRVGLLSNGQVAEAIERDPNLKDIVPRFAQAVFTSQALATELDRPGAVRNILRQLTPLNREMTRLASVANMLSAERVAADQSQLSRTHWVLSGMLAGLIFCAAALVLLLLRHNEMLAHAQSDLRKLASNLEEAGDELVEANHAVREANAELRQQNEALQQRDRELQLQNHRFDTALNNMSQGLCMADSDSRITVWNRRFSELFGLPLQGLSADDAISGMVGWAIRDAQGGDSVFSAVAARQRILARQNSAGDFTCDGEDGRAVAVLQRPMQGGGWVATYEDITDRRRVEARIRHMAHHDALTNLPNRLLLHERLESGLRVSRETGIGMAVLMIDLDLFKDVNDTLGHPAGDALLVIVGQRLRSCVSGDDLVARLGGDEFAIVQSGVTNSAQCSTLAGRVVDVLQAPYDLEGQRITVSGSIGISIAPDHGWDPDQLMKSADMALYSAKARGRANFCFFEPEMEADVQERRVLGLELREALSRQDFEVFYQPVVSLVSNQPCGFEALIRWRHRERGLILPGRFIPLAEEMGLISALGEWVLQQACKDCASWPDNLRVAVNLSPHQLTGGNVVKTVEKALGAAGLSPTRLELEITESVLLQENEANLAALFALRALGVRIALDDFGTGFSSLSYLRRFPFDKVKVDRSFVQGMGDDPDALAIVHSIADLAPKLGMRTTAEGIETARELAQVRAAGCSEGQGFYFGRPMRRADVQSYLSAIPMPGASPDSEMGELVHLPSPRSRIQRMTLRDGNQETL